MFWLPPLISLLWKSTTFQHCSSWLKLCYIGWGQMLYINPTLELEKSNYWRLVAISTLPFVIFFIITKISQLQVISFYCRSGYILKVLSYLGVLGSVLILMEWFLALVHGQKFHVKFCIKVVKISYFFNPLVHLVNHWWIGSVIDILHI